MLPAGIFTLVQSNLVQTYLAKKLSTYLSGKLKTEVSIEKVEIRFFMDVMLKNVYIEDQHKNVLIKSGKINLKLGDFDLSGNFFELKKVALENTFFNLRKYKNEEKLNLQFIINFFKTEKKKAVEKGKYPFKLLIDKFDLSNSGFSFIDDNKVHNNNGVVDFNDLKISRLNIDMENVAILGDSVYAKINSLCFDEKSGFIVNGFSARSVVSKRNIIVNNLLVKTPNSDIDLDLAFVYSDFRSFKDFLNKVTIISDIRNTSLNLIDIAYFVKQMHGMNNRIDFSSKVKGKVSNLKLKNFIMKYGSETYFDADIAMNGLPKIKDTYINMKIRNLTTTVNDLNNIIIPAPERKITHLKLPLILQRLGNIRLKGIFTGFYSNFVSNATLNSGIGSVSTDIIVNNTDKNISYDGKIVTENFNLGQLLNSNEMLGKVSLDAQIKGSGLNINTASLLFKGNIQQFEFKKYFYSGLSVNGDFDKKIFSGIIKSNDKNLKMDFNGNVNLNDTLPDFDFTADIEYANLKNLNLLTKDSISEIKGLLYIDFYGNNIDNLRGNISISNASFKENKKFFELKSLKLITNINKTGYRTFDLKSDYVDAVFNGYFVFSELTNSFKRFILNYIPNFYFALDTNNKSIARQEFDFDIKLYNASPVIRYFLPDVSVAANTTIKGKFNSITNAAVIDAVSSKLNYKDYHFANWKLDANASAGTMNLLMNSDTLKVSDSSYISYFGLKSQVINDSIFSKIYWDNKKAVDRNAADLNFYTYFYSNSESIIGFKNSEVVIDDSLWTISNLGNVVFDTAKISFNNLMMSRKLQSIVVNGTISRNPLDVVSLKFNSFDVSNIDYLTNAKKFDLDGIITGNVYVSDLYSSPTFFADVKVKEFGFNHDKLGDATILSKWDDIKKGIHINAEINYIGSVGISKPVIANGYYYPGNKPQNFDIDINVNNLRLKSLTRYIASFGSIIDGSASGMIYLRGTSKKPELTGNLKLMRTALKINYLNTIYAFAYDSLKISNNDFSFKNMVVIDQSGKDTAILNGRIYHENFKNFGFDIYISPDKLLCLNTNSSMNETFYGKAYATGNAHIYGNSKKINFDISARTEKGTFLYIPVGSTSILQNNDYITFVDKNQKISVGDERGKEIKGINLDMAFDVTDDAEIQLLFDPRTGDRIRGEGNGNIRVAINSDGEMNIFGDYILTSGDYLFTFQNIINKRFIIDQGSTVKWNGDPYNAELDIRARYKIKSNLSGLGVDTNSRYVPVECIINIKNVLANPEFSFEVDLPSLTDYEKAPYISAINQNLNNNFISLLIINSFVSPNTGIGQTASAGASLLGKSASEVLSNQLSNWLSQISKNVNIGVNYRPGDNISQEEVEVALSTQLFNDRVTVSSNLGVATGQNTGSNKNSNQIVGDVDIEVKISKALKLIVYNHTNQYDILQYTAPYSQGLGIVYRKEFNYFKDLFKKKNKVIKNKNLIEKP